MKAKKTSRPTRHRNANDEPLPHELGAHLFALIKRNLLSRGKSAPEAPSQLTFAF
jgi:hypothetical protein